jgi:hypothetical protein
MGNFMKKQYLVHNNNAVENQVIADQLFELSKGDLRIENPEELTGTNQVLKALGIQNNPSNNKKKQSNQRHGGGRDNKKQQFKRRK